MKTFTYTDNITGKIVFQINAQSITDADEAYAKALGKHPSKLGHIGCRIS